MPPSPYPAAAAISRSIQADADHVHQGRLQSECASFFVAATPVPARGVVLMLHGFTAGPYQYRDMAQRLAGAGLHSYAARLPGHGACLHDGTPSHLELPRSGELSRYAEAAQVAFKQARALAEAEALPLSVIGFSMGGALALDLALQSPEKIARLVLLAPLLRPYGRKVQHAFALLSLLRCFGIGALLDRVPFSWGKRVPAAPGDWVRPGHWDFRLGHIFTALSYAYGVQSRPTALQVPTQLFISSADNKCDPDVAERLLRRSMAAHHVYRFPASRGVPHGMMSRQENPYADTIEQIETVVEQFLLRGEGVTDPE